MVYQIADRGQAPYKLLRIGVDTIEVAFQGALPAENLAFLELMRKEAEKKQDLHTFFFCDDVVKIQSFGARGGYAYVLDTGILGERICIKNSTDAKQWNIHVTFSAHGLLEKGVKKMKKTVIQKLKKMGAVILQESIGRVDVAIDINANDFILKPKAFTKHSHMSSKAHQIEEVNYHNVCRRNTYVCHGSRGSKSIQSVVYDKTLKVRQDKDYFWFDHWGVPEEKINKNFTVWRIEVRAFQRYLKDKIDIRTFADLERKLKTLTQDILHKVRLDHYADLDKRQDRRRTHPLWKFACEGVRRLWGEINPKHLKGRIIACLRSEKIKEAEEQFIGSVKNLLALKEYEYNPYDKEQNNRMFRDFFEILANCQGEGTWSDLVFAKMEKAKEKYIYLSEKNMREFQEKYISERKPISIVPEYHNTVAI